MIIKSLSEETARDWFDFFDERAFTDNPDWKGCYCTHPFIPRFEQYPSKNRARKPYAKWLIESGRMRGYLAYEQETVVGWCNVNKKSALPRYNKSGEDNDKILSIVCFLIQKEYRRQGIAGNLLDRVIRDARLNGFHIIEAYPRLGSKSEYNNYHGPGILFEKNGFVFEEINGKSVARLYL